VIATVLHALVAFLVAVFTHLATDAGEPMPGTHVVEPPAVVEPAAPAVVEPPAVVDVEPVCAPGEEWDTERCVAVQLPGERSAR
jgi:hypothetical protein